MNLSTPWDLPVYGRLCQNFGRNCCDIAFAQINYPSLNKEDSIEKARGRSHEEVLVQIFMLYDMQLGGILRLSRL
jgi:hypothetical protein